MTEFWVEENIQPLTHQDSDRLLIDYLEPIINKEKRKGIISWHFLREGDGWKVNQPTPHIRLRLQAKDLAHQKRTRRSLKRKLDLLQLNQQIIDHYVGSHGRPVKKFAEYYSGEQAGFDEHVQNPLGWQNVKKMLEAGSELALVLIKGRMNRVQLGNAFDFYKIAHLFPNQCRHYPFFPPVQNWPQNWIAYDCQNPSP